MKSSNNIFSTSEPFCSAITTRIFAKQQKQRLEHASEILYETLRDGKVKQPNFLKGSAIPNSSIRAKLRPNNEQNDSDNQFKITGYPKNEKETEEQRKARIEVWYRKKFTIGKSSNAEDITVRSRKKDKEEGRSTFKFLCESIRKSKELKATTISNISIKEESKINNYAIQKSDNSLNLRLPYQFKKLNIGILENNGERENSSRKLNNKRRQNTVANV